MTCNSDPENSRRLSGQSAPLARQTLCRRVRIQTERQLWRPFIGLIRVLCGVPRWLPTIHI